MDVNNRSSYYLGRILFYFSLVIPFTVTVIAYFALALFVSKFALWLWVIDIKQQMSDKNFYSGLSSDFFVIIGLTAFVWTGDLQKVIHNTAARNSQAGPNRGVRKHPYPHEPAVGCPSYHCASLRHQFKWRFLHHSPHGLPSSLCLRLLSVCVPQQALPTNGAQICVLKAATQRTGGYHVFWHALCSFGWICRASAIVLCPFIDAM